jgi:hypothetical protein
MLLDSETNTENINSKSVNKDNDQIEENNLISLSQIQIQKNKVLDYNNFHIEMIDFEDVNIFIFNNIYIIKINLGN